MATIAENLQTLINHKAAIKAALDRQSKEPTDALGAYAGLIDSLENPDKVEYFVTTGAGEKKAYAQLVGEEKVDLTATANDIREGTVAIIDSGVAEGEKFIPGYHTSQGFRVIDVGSELKIQLLDFDKYDYTKFQAVITPFNTSLDDSVAVTKAVIEDCVYNANSTDAISNVKKDDANKTILFGIINDGDVPLIIRYFTYKEVP